MVVCGAGARVEGVVFGGDVWPSVVPAAQLDVRDDNLDESRCVQVCSLLQALAEASKMMKRKKARRARCVFKNSYPIRRPSRAVS